MSPLARFAFAQPRKVLFGLERGACQACHLNTLQLEQRLRAAPDETSRRTVLQTAAPRFLEISKPIVQPAYLVGVLVQGTCGMPIMYGQWRTVAVALIFATFKHFAPLPRKQDRFGAEFSTTTVFPPCRRTGPERYREN